MTEIETLLQQFCPDGVEYKELGKCIEKISNISWVNADAEEYQYIDLSSVDRNTHQICESSMIHADDAPSRAQQIVRKGDILFGTTRPMLKRYCEVDAAFDGQICSTGFCVLRANSSIVSNRWIYHQIASTDFFSHVEKFQKGASYPAISDKNVKIYRIPVPPLPVQEKIVGILDKFTEATSELTNRLHAEEELLKKQYTYYECSLLESNNTAKKIKLGELCNISRGKVISKGFIAKNPGKFPVYSSQTENEGKLGEISEFAYDGEYLTWTTDGANAGTVFYRDGKFSITNVCGLLKPTDDSINIKFLYYFLKSEAPNHVSRGMGNPKLMSNVVANIVVPIPPLAEQERIVTILDRFDALRHDLTFGLPAEIEARRKQYEYYRDKLLTFKEMEV